jgi:hypothetical protein
MEHEDKLTQIARMLGGEEGVSFLTEGRKLEEDLYDKVSDCMASFMETAPAGDSKAQAMRCAAMAEATALAFAKALSLATHSFMSGDREKGIKLGVHSLTLKYKSAMDEYAELEKADTQKEAKDVLAQIKEAVAKHKPNAND